MEFLSNFKLFLLFILAVFRVILVCMEYRLQILFDTYSA